MKGKKLLLITFVAVGFLGFFNDTETFAAELPTESRMRAMENTMVATATNPFPNLSDNDLVLVFPDGSVLYGEMEIEYPKSEDENTLLDSESDSRSITYGEYKKVAEKNAVEENSWVSRPQLRGASPAPASTIKTLKSNGSYKSNAFSASGWRFAESNFKPEAGTGMYLRWQTYKDSAMVGSASDAQSTYRTGLGYGTAIYTGAARYITSPNSVTTYYTLNPVNGSHYTVSNW